MRYAGVPTGGSDTGASEVKTAKERKRFGGFANAPAGTGFFLAFLGGCLLFD